MTEQQYANHYRIGIESQIDQLTEFLTKNGHVITGQFKDDFELCITLAYTAAVFATADQMKENPAVFSFIQEVTNKVVSKLGIEYEHITPKDWEDQKRADAQAQPTPTVDPIRDPDEYRKMLRSILKLQITTMFKALDEKRDVKPEEDPTLAKLVFMAGFLIGMLNCSSQIITNVTDAKIIQQVCAEELTECGVTIKYGDGLKAPTIPKHN